MFTSKSTVLTTLVSECSWIGRQKRQVISDKVTNAVEISCIYGTVDFNRLEVTNSLLKLKDKEEHSHNHSR